MSNPPSRTEPSWAEEAAQPSPGRELPENLHSQILELAERGDELAGQGAYPKAIDSYREAVDLLPRPRAHWNAATWLLVAIADAQFLSGDFAGAEVSLENAKFCPGAIGNPFVHMRLGQSLLELGNRDRALDELARAYMTAGREIFEDEDPKYLAELSKVLQPPSGQDSL
jgi:tetratricopeptide (TPR) repeat protein